MLYETPTSEWNFINIFQLIHISHSHRRCGHYNIHTLLCGTYMFRFCVYFNIFRNTMHENWFYRCLGVYPFECSMCVGLWISYAFCIVMVGGYVGGLSYWAYSIIKLINLDLYLLKSFFFCLFFIWNLKWARLIFFWKERRVGGYDIN